MEYVLNNVYISNDRKHQEYLEMKQVYIDLDNDDFKDLCKYFNGEDITGQSAISFERANVLTWRQVQ